MNIKLALASLLTMATAFAQSPIGNPFAGLGIEFYGFFLPWIFTFAIVFGLLINIKLFNKNINMALAFVVAFFVTATGGPQLAAFFTQLFGGASIFLAGILVVMLFAAMVGVNFSTHNPKEMKHIIALVVVVAIGILLFLASSGSFVAINVIGPDLAGMLFWVVVIVAAIYFVIGKDEKGEESPKGK